MRSFLQRFLPFLFLASFISSVNVFADDASALNKAADQFGLRPATEADEAQSQGNLVQVQVKSNNTQDQGSSGQNIVVRENSGDTAILPPVPQSVVDEIGGSPSGVGGVPAASDGPVSYPGVPAGYPNPNTRTEGPGATGNSPLSKAEQQANEEAFGLFFGPLFSEEIAKDLAAEEDAYWDYVSGSGGLFGDCVGADCIPAFGSPGRPFGGLPIGSWVHHDLLQVNRRFADDSLAVSAVNQGNFREAETLISGALGQQVQRDPQGRGF